MFLFELVDLDRSADSILRDTDGDGCASEAGVKDAPTIDSLDPNFKGCGTAVCVFRSTFCVEVGIDVYDALNEKEARRQLFKNG